MSLLKLKSEIRKASNAKRALLLQRFFKTGKGEYGEGDVFIGLTVPQCRMIARRYAEIRFLDINRLLHSRIHEERLIALLVLVQNFQKGSQQEKKSIFRFYMRSLDRINNWDLVDLSAHKIVGAYLLDRPRTILATMAKKDHVWTQRISIIATFSFIQHGQFDDSLKIAKLLLHHDHDLIHKAVGWMLREVGKKDVTVEEKFLQKYYRVMPRTMLRYAIERFPERKRISYLNGRA